MDPHCHPCPRSSWASLHWAVPQASLGREGHAIRPCLFPHGRGFPAPSHLCHSPMMYHPVPFQRARHHLLPAIPALDPSLLSLPVGRSLSRHPLPVRRLRLGPCRLAWAADHAECLTEIGQQFHPIEQADQGTKCTLDQLRVRRCNHATVRVQ